MGHLGVGKHGGRQLGVVPAHQPFMTGRSWGPVNPESRGERSLCRGITRKTLNPSHVISYFSYFIAGLGEESTGPPVFLLLHSLDFSPFPHPGQCALKY